MFGIGGFELFLILLFGFLIFGPDKLPDMAKTVGRGIAKFRDAQKEMNETLNEVYDPNSDEPFKDPTAALDKLAHRQEERAKEREKANEGKKAHASKSEAKAAAPSGAGTADSTAEGGAESPRQESFTERKARYERERAARKAAEVEAATSAASADGDDADASAAPDTAVESSAEKTADTSSAASPEPASKTEGGE